MNTPAVPSIFDTQSLSALKGGLSRNDPKALRAAAQQFEAVFLQMMLKSMRAATPQNSMFDSEQTRFYQELLDSQLAQVMSAKGSTGLAAMIERQMKRGDAATPHDEGGLPLTPADRGSYPLVPPPRPLTPQNTSPAPIPLQGSPVRPAVSASGSVDAQVQAQTFVGSLWPHAVEASQRTGIPPQFMLAQAALESGWGRHEPRLADGQSSHNLFGIKAGGDWQGPVAESVTTEYVDGRAVQRVERFRAYASYSAAFDDYARLLTTQPRYASLLGVQDAQGFARGLQGAGYATDPAYAEKLVRVMGHRAFSLSSSG